MTLVKSLSTELYLIFRTKSTSGMGYGWDGLPEEMGEDLEPLDLGLDEEERVAGSPHQVLRITRRHGVGVRHQAHCTTPTTKFSVADPGSLSRILIFTHSGSRIQK